MDLGRAESRPALLIVRRCARGESKRFHRIRMNQKELKELIEFLIEKDIAEFELERGDVRVRIKRAAEPGVHPRTEAHYFAVHPAQPPVPDVGNVPVAGAPGSPAVPLAAPAAIPEESLHMVKSPIVGTFYESASPGSPPFVRVGETVQPGKVLCIIESMKLMNEIEAEIGGVIVSKLVPNAQPVEYGEALFAIRPV